MLFLVHRPGDLALTMVVFNKSAAGAAAAIYQKQQAALGDVNGNIQEIIEGLKVVKAFTHEEQAKDQFFARLNETYRDAGTAGQLLLHHDHARRRAT